MTCDTCANWTVRRRRLYDNGSEIITYEAPAGKGHCEKLGIETPTEFHCAAYFEGDDHVVTERRDGAPWDHFEYRPCPDCNGRGSVPEADNTCCQRCMGTARVRFYEDGYVGEEATRLHPEEKKALEDKARLARRKALEAELAGLTDSEEAVCTDQGTMVLTDPSPIAGRSRALKERIVLQRPEDQGFL